MSTDKTNILNYLPPQQRQRVLLLIQRLQEQTQAKNKFQALYNQSKNELNELTLKYNKLKDQNAYLKQQMHNSFSMISQVRANFQANKKKLASKKEENDDWEEEADEVEEQNQPNSSNHILKIPPRQLQKTPLQKYKPQDISADKSTSVLNVSSSFLNNTSTKSGSKSNSQLDQLRREVKAIQQLKQKEQQKAKQLNQKHRLVDEIKNRYKSQQDESSSKIKQKSIEKIEIQDTFLQQQSSNTKIKNSKIKKIQQKPTKVQKKTPMKSNIQTKVQGKKSNHHQQDYGNLLDFINDYYQ